MRLRKPPLLSITAVGQQAATTWGPFVLMLGCGADYYVPNSESSTSNFGVGNVINPGARSAWFAGRNENGSPPLVNRCTRRSFSYGGGERIIPKKNKKPRPKRC